MGKDILEWLAKECIISRLLPEGMVSPEKRTEENVRDIGEHWWAHGGISIVGKRTIAQSRSQTGQRERDERNHPWVVVITLSDEKLNTGKSLGKTLGQEVVSFQRSKAPLAIQNRMHQSRSEPGALVSEIETKQVEAGALTERPVTTEGRKCPNLDERRRTSGGGDAAE